MAGPACSGGDTAIRAVVPSASAGPRPPWCHRLAGATGVRGQLAVRSHGHPPRSSWYAGTCRTWVTMVLPLTLCVVVVTVTPDPLVVATECATWGPLRPARPAWPVPGAAGPRSSSRTFRGRLPGKCAGPAPPVWLRSRRSGRRGSSWTSAGVPDAVPPFAGAGPEAGVPGAPNPGSGTQPSWSSDRIHPCVVPSVRHGRICR